MAPRKVQLLGIRLNTCSPLSKLRRSGALRVVGPFPTVFSLIAAGAHKPDPSAPMTVAAPAVATRPFPPLSPGNKPFPRLLTGKALPQGARAWLSPIAEGGDSNDREIDVYRRVTDRNPRPWR